MDMSNEPVAWMNENNHIVGGSIPPSDFVYSWKPLYTFPVLEVMEFEVDRVAYWDGKVPNSTGLSYFKTATCKVPLYTHPADHEKTFNEMVELYEKQLDKKADRIAELEKELKRTKFAWNLAENEIEQLRKAQEK